MARPVEIEDLPYCWAAYRRGVSFELPDGLDKANFTEQLTSMILAHYGVWTLLAKSMPVGLVFGSIAAFLSRPESLVVQLGGAIWFPEATSRNKVEVMVSLLNGLRDVPAWFIWVTTIEHKAFAVHMCRYGIARRIGTLEDLAMFQVKPR